MILEPRRRDRARPSRPARSAASSSSAAATAPSRAATTSATTPSRVPAATRSSSRSAAASSAFATTTTATLLGLPRLLDMGQCNDAYGAIMVAVELAEAFKCGVNDLPLTLVVRWFEQKAVAVLLTLL